jgi:hypothetical protein
MSSPIAYLRCQQKSFVRVAQLHMTSNENEYVVIFTYEKDIRSNHMRLIEVEEKVPPSFTRYVYVIRFLSSFLFELFVCFSSSSSSLLRLKMFVSLNRRIYSHWQRRFSCSFVLQCEILDEKVRMTLCCIDVISLDYFIVSQMCFVLFSIFGCVYFYSLSHDYCRHALKYCNTSSCDFVDYDRQHRYDLIGKTSRLNAIESDIDL